MIYNADDLVNSRDWPQRLHKAHVNDRGSWVLCRPADGNMIRRRIKAAFMVLTGKADALTWTGQ